MLWGNAWADIIDVAVRLVHICLWSSGPGCEGVHGRGIVFTPKLCLTRVTSSGGVGGNRLLRSRRKREIGMVHLDENERPDYGAPVGGRHAEWIQLQEGRRFGVWAWFS